MAPTVISPFLILKSRIYMVLQEKDKNLLRSLHQGTSSRVIGSSKLQRCWRSCKRSDIYSETEGALGVTSRKRLFIIAYNAYSPLSCHSRLQGVGENKEEGRYRGREGGNGGWGGARASVTSRRPVATAPEVETGSLSPQASRLPWSAHTHAAALFTWMASSLRPPSRQRRKRCHRGRRPTPLTDRHPRPPAGSLIATLNPARAGTNTARARTRRRWLTVEATPTWECLGARVPRSYT